MDRGKIIKYIDVIIEICFLAIIFLVPVYFAFFQENYNIFELNKLIIFRLFLWLIVISTVLKIFISGKLILKGGFKIIILIFLIFSSYLISSIFSIHQNLSLWGSYSRQQGFYSLVAYLIFFLVLIVNLKGLKQINRIIVTAVIASFFTCLYGLMQYFMVDWIVWSEDFIKIGRIFSSLGQPNFFAHYLSLVIPLSLYALIFIGKKLISRFSIAVVLFMQLACLILTYSRAAWLGFFASLFTLFIGVLLIRGYKKIAICAVVAVCLLFTYSAFININDASGLEKIRSQPQITIINRIKSVFQLNINSNQIRIFYWQSALNKIKNSSFIRLSIGYGPETLESIFLEYYRPTWGVYEKINTVPDRSHDGLLDIILMYGIFGFLVISVFFIYIIIKSIIYLKKIAKGINDESNGLIMENGKEGLSILFLLSALAAYFINILFSFSLTVAYIYLYLTVAIIWFIINKNANEKSINININIITKSAILIMLLSLSIFFTKQDLDYWLADHYYIKAAKAESEADCQKILGNIEKTVVNYPLIPYYKERYLYYYLSCFTGAKNEASRELMQKNITEMINKINPDDYTYTTYYSLGHIYTLLGSYLDSDYYNLAEKMYSELIGLNPNFTIPYRFIAKIKIQQGDYDLAINMLMKALEIIPTTDNPALNYDHEREIKNELLEIYELLGMAYSQKHDFDQALSYYRLALAADPLKAVLYKNVADVYYLRGDFNQAIFYNLRGQKLNPSDYKWEYALALLNLEKDDYISALNHAQQALKLSPNNKDIELLIDDVEKKKGNNL